MRTNLNKDNSSNESKSPGSKFLLQSPNSAKRKFKFHEVDNVNFSLQEVESDSKNINNSCDLGTILNPHQPNRKKEKEQIQLESPAKNKVENPKEFNKGKKLNLLLLKNQRLSDIPSINSDAESSQTNVKRLNISRYNTGTYSNKGSNGFHRCGSVESFTPSKSIFGLMLPQRSQATYSLKSENEEDKDKINPSDPDNALKEDDILIPFPELPAFEEEDSKEDEEKSLQFFEQNSNECEVSQCKEGILGLKTNSLEKYIGNKPGNLENTPVQKSLAKLEKFNLQEDLENVYQQIQDKSIDING